MKSSHENQPQMVFAEVMTAYGVGSSDPEAMTGTTLEAISRGSGRRMLLISLTISFSMASWLEQSADLFSCLSFLNSTLT